MSFHHANITWQSPDGAWSCGFFERIPGNTMDEDYDAEWDDGFDTNRFQFVSTGHPDEDSARDAWGGPNPGSTTTIPCDDSTAEEIEQYEDMAARKYEESSPRPREPGILGLGGNTLGYYGPPKPRTLKAIKAERDSIVERQASESLGGYAHNLRDSDALAGLEPRIQRELSASSRRWRTERRRRWRRCSPRSQRSNPGGRLSSPDCAPVSTAPERPTGGPSGTSDSATAVAPEPPQSGPTR